jgi:PhzF family phenazine biosynthesis protein
VTTRFVNRPAKNSALGQKLILTPAIFAATYGIDFEFSSSTPQAKSTLMHAANYYHVDVFGTGPFTGNGLGVFLDGQGFAAEAMQRLTQEMKHFESIFLSQADRHGAMARIFTVEEELPFAGHPSLGAAAVLHRIFAPHEAHHACTLHLPTRKVDLKTTRHSTHVVAEMNQGVADLGRPLRASEVTEIVQDIGLGQQDLANDRTIRVASTGLPFLLLPLQSEAFARVNFNGRNIATKLSALGAKFLCALDPNHREIRTWDNCGKVEDVATGSAAGPCAAYLFDEGIADRQQPVTLAQGRFAGRPCQLGVRADDAKNIHVSGQVWPLAHGEVDLPVAFLRDNLGQSQD